ncbi:hypothetical protein [Romboutsia lituseburensis]|uniref:hypothetical protein n=1 Tax=Romboutsia lituseburensis TaxID=1537 RepID=UPI0022EA93E7|nr:hypothetical protein [Romboutsia lituseburensis]
MLKTEIWDGTTPINGVSAESILENRKDIARNLNDVFLVVTDNAIVTEIQFGKTIADNYNIDVNKSLKEIAEEYLIIKEKETKEESVIKDQTTLEEQSKKIDILQAENNRLKEVEKEQDKMIMDNMYKMTMIESSIGGM